MDTLIGFTAVFLILAYGGLGVWLLLRQHRSSSVLLTGGGLLLGGVFLYRYLFTAAEFITWALVTVFALCVIGKLFE